ncbi:lantibiotic immunity ABC transporter MutE/EpiE family permease subunit [Lachnospiraceae bacterium KGMB03038]|nr:lantibiotic immunity ABC transporter MutE/EpiE family permease subunit [Lachnospiraceae bacterium KGMB03038]
MKTYFRAEMLKYRHTSMKGLAVGMPLITVFLAAWLTHQFFAVDSYNWWYIGMYPGFLGILCGLIGGKDKRKKNHTIWSLPCAMEKIWDGKILVGAVISGVSVICVTVFTILAGELMESILHIQYLAKPSIGAQILAGVLMWLTTLWEIPFCLFLSQKMSTFLMLVIHVGLYAVLAAAVSLTSWFALVPGAITARLMCPVLGVLPNGLIAQPGSMTYSVQMTEMGSLFLGIPAALLWFGVLWWGSRKWFGRQVSSK